MAVTSVAPESDESVRTEEARDRVAAVVTRALTGPRGRLAFRLAGMAIEPGVEGDPEEPVVSLRVDGRYVDVFVRADA